MCHSREVIPATKAPAGNETRAAGNHSRRTATVLTQRPEHGRLLNQAVASCQSTY